MLQASRLRNNYFLKSFVYRFWTKVQDCLVHKKYKALKKQFINCKHISSIFKNRHDKNIKPQTLKYFLSAYYLFYHLNFWVMHIFIGELLRPFTLYLLSLLSNLWYPVIQTEELSLKSALQTKSLAGQPHLSNTL